MNRRQTLALLGGVLLVFGVFSPVAQALWITVDFYAGGEGDGVLVLILVAIATPLLLTGRFLRVALFPVVLIAAILLYDFLNIYDKTQEVGGLGWGWLPLFAGEALLVAAAATRRTEKRPPDIAGW